MSYQNVSPVKNPPGRENHGIDMAGPIKSLPIIGSPQKSLFPGRQFTGKNPSRPGGRRAGRIFASKLSAGGDFYWGRSYNGASATLARSLAWLALLMLGGGCVSCACIGSLVYEHATSRPTHTHAYTRTARSTCYVADLLVTKRRRQRGVDIQLTSPRR